MSAEKQMDVVIDTSKYEKIKNVYIYSIHNENITVVSKQFYEKGITVNEADMMEVAVKNIQSISTGRADDWWKGAVGGAVAGFALGFGLGYGIYNNGGDIEWAFSEAASFALVLGVAAIPIGGTIGSIPFLIKKTFKINGRQDAYDIVKPELERRSIRYYYR